MALFARDRPEAEPAAGGGAYRYWAFLSYSHADTRAADRLHRWLEHFRIADPLVGQPHPMGTIPKRLSPIFRDRSELAASSSLGREIEEALGASRYLIVLCSPAAAKSRWVDQEVRNFKRLHGEDRVLAAIVSGEPFSEGEDECFPPALRHRVGRDGKLTRQKVEPIAADLRDDRDGERIGSMKIAAGMLEVGLDDLIQRDQQRRQRRMSWIVGASIAGMAFTTGLSVFAIDSRDAARDERREAEGLVSFLLGDLREELEPIGRLDALDQVGARALAYYERQDKTDLTDDQLAQRSKALTLLGQIATERGDTDGALARYREALRSTAELVERAPDNPERLFDHAQNVFWMGELARRRGQMSQAESSYREYKNLADRMVAIDPDNAKWRMEELYAKENIGIVLFYQRRFADAAREIDEAIPAMERLARNNPGNAEYQSELSVMLAWLGDARRDQGRLDLAIAARSKQIRLLHGLSAGGSHDVQLREKLIWAQLALSILLTDTGQLDPAIDQLKAAIADARALMVIEPDNAIWKSGAAIAHLDYSAALLQRRELAAAVQQADTGCTLIAQLRQRDPSVASWRAFQTSCHLVRAKLSLAAGTLGDPLASADQALASARTERSGDPVKDRYRIASAYRLIGDVHRRTGNARAAREAWLAGLDQLPQNIVERPSELGERAGLLRRLGRNADARPLVGRLREMGYRRVV